MLSRTTCRASPSEHVRRLLLWDIDGTLITGGGVGSHALESAAASVASLVHVPKVDMHGKTDPQILREIFVAAEIADDVADALVPEAMTAGEAALAAAADDLRARGGVLPGVVDVLERLDATAGVRQTLVTGNLTGNAAVKLATFELTRFFDAEVGAYGTDHADRLELVPISLERVARLRGERYDGDEVWVSGDTPNDLACARAGGVRCLLVGTGSGLDVVRDLGADAVVADLTDAERVLDVLLS
jgi:phosphoglycolate phosphatase-like HAD superfamily hydrolase